MRFLSRKRGSMHTRRWIKTVIYVLMHEINMKNSISCKRASVIRKGGRSSIRYRRHQTLHMSDAKKIPPNTDPGS